MAPFGRKNRTFGICLVFLSQIGIGRKKHFKKAAVLLSVLNCVLLEALPPIPKEATHPFNPVISPRCGIDIGEDSTRIQISMVDLTRWVLIGKPAAKTLKTPFRSTMTTDGQLSESTAQSAVASIRAALIELAGGGIPENSRLKCVAIATSVFRNAKNGSEVAKMISRSLGSPVFIVTPEDEAKLTFLSSVTSLGRTLSNRIKQESIIIWNLTQENMYFVSRPASSRGAFEIVRSKLTPERFRKETAKKIQKGRSITSASPGLPSEVQAGISMAKESAESLPTGFKKRIGDVSNRIMGTGEIHEKSLRPRLQKPGNIVYSFQDLSSYIGRLFAVNTADTKLDDASISDLLLVSGFMEAFRIPAVTVVENQLVDGILIYPQFWKN